ncbi:SCO family protein [Ideonella sp. DXS29W]|uniref:SCO family protein n=1 Tax=Ideonella lacteola TaxID=2984193 RepID=A0ABU9BPK6_9BURK
MQTNATRRRTLRLASWTLVAAAAGLVGCTKKTVAFQGIDITGAEYARELKLPDADGKVRSLADFKGKVAIVFFGYTQCPDVCPTTLAEIAAVKKKLGADGDKVVGVFVSVDPERDTPQVLKAYVEAFGKDFVALRGTLDETKAVAREFKVFYAKVPGTTDGSYTMDHTANSYIFDPQGRVRLAQRYGAGVDAVAHDVKALLDGA